MIKIFILFFALNLNCYGNNTPSPTNTSNQEFNLRGFYKFFNLNTMAEYKFRANEKRSNQNFLTLGARYRLLNNLNIGLFYQLEKGARHVDDWILQNNVWQWRETEDRAEDNIIVELAPKFLFEFLPGERWVFELRTRGKLNLFNEQETIKIRPGLTYYWFQEGQPFMSFYLQHEIYFAMNYGQDTIYQRWTYLGMLYHYSKKLKFSPFINFGFERWSNTDSFTKQTGSVYSVRENFNNIGLNFIFIL